MREKLSTSSISTARPRCRGTAHATCCSRYLQQTLPVGQSGQRIVVRQVAHPRLALAQLVLGLLGPHQELDPLREQHRIDAFGGEIGGAGVVGAVAPTPCRPGWSASISARGGSRAARASARHTSKPLMPGMTTSSTTQSAGSARNALQRAPAVGGGDDAKSRHLQCGAHQQPGAGIVVDDEHRRRMVDLNFGGRSSLSPTRRSAIAPASVRRKILDILCGFSAPIGAACDPALAHQYLAFLGERGEARAAEIGGAGFEGMHGLRSASACTLAAAVSIAPIRPGECCMYRSIIEFSSAGLASAAILRSTPASISGTRDKSRRSDSGSARSASQRLSSAASCCCVKGLLRKSSMPAARHRSRSPSMALAVNAMMGTRAAPDVLFAAPDLRRSPSVRP